MRRRSRCAKWAAPNNPTRPARQVWRALYPKEPWPKGWRVEWAGFMRGAAGLCIYGERRILISYGDAARDRGAFRGAVSTLLHEFLHVRNPRLRHGKDFRAAHRWLLGLIGLA